MSVNRPRKRGSYAPLSVNYYKDAAIVAAGPMAEVLYVRSLAFCAEVLSDGFIAREQVRFLTQGLRKPGTLRALLVHNRLWTETDEGYIVTRWLDYNRTREDILGAERKDRTRKNPQVRGSEDGSATSVSERKGSTDSDRIARAPARAFSSSSSTPEKKSPTGPSTVAALPRQDPPGRDDDDARLPATVETSIGANDVVAAWIEATQSNGVSPTARFKGMVAREAKSLLDSGNDPDRVLKAAIDAGTKGFPNLERELTAMSGRAIPKRIANKPTRDDKVRALLELAQREEARNAE
jgi:hypothetical protein